MHIDALGKNIEIDDYVAYPQSNKLMLGRVAKLANKMVVIESVIKKRKNKYTSELKEIYRKPNKKGTAQFTLPVGEQLRDNQAEYLANRWGIKPTNIYGSTIV